MPVDFFQRTNVACDARFHRRRQAHRLMDVSEMVVHKVQRDRARKHLQFSILRKYRQFELVDLASP